MSEIKARQIQEFLAQFPADTWSAEAEAASIAGARMSAGKKASGTGSSVTGSSPEPGTVLLPESLSLLIAAAARTMGEVVTLLLSVHAPEFRSRLLRELSRLAQRAETLLLDAAFLAPKEQEKAARRLRRAGKEIAEVSALASIERKTQANLADSLAEHCLKLAEVKVESEPSDGAGVENRTSSESSSRKRA